MPDSVQQHVWPVWGNTYWVKNCLGLYEGIAKHADELNGQYAHFFGLVQKLSLDAAALGICRLYDQGGGRYALDTIPRLIGYLRNHLTEEYIPLLKSEMLMSLGADEHSARDIVNNLKNDGASLATRNCLCDFLDRLSPAWDRTPALKRLKIYRDKRIAHQERLSDSLKDQLKSLPSISDMETINAWAETFCQLVTRLISGGALLPHSESARIATLNVIAKVLDKNFDDIRDADTYREYEAFYSRL